jgi:AraC-like DNA-binding protein
MSAATVMASVTRTLIDFGATRGLDKDRMVRRAGIDRDELERKDARIPRAADVAVWEQLCAALGTHGVGLDFADTRPGPRAYGVVALRDMTADTFGDALRRHSRHHRVIRDDVSAILLETGEGATVFLAKHGGRLACSPSMAEAALAPYVIHARAWTACDVSPEEVCFEHAAPLDASRYEALFRCPIRFDQSATSIRFSREVLELPLTHAQKELCEYLDASAHDALARLHHGELADVVYRALSVSLARGDSSIETIARTLGLGVRTLQRRLKEEAVCYQDVVDTVRHHRALELLLEAGHPVAWISDHLGFSDPRAFRRAFARWTGMSPDRYRRMRWVREVA